MFSRLLSELFVKFGADTTEFDEKGRRVKKSLEDIKGESDSAVSAIARLGTTARTAFAAISGVALAGVGAGAYFVKAAADAESFRIRMEVLTGSAEKASKVIRELTEFSVKTPFTPEQVKGAGANLIAFGLDPDQVVEHLRMIGDVAAGAQVPFEHLANIYGKVLTQGRLNGEDIMQFGEQGVPVLQALAAALGLTVTETRKLVSEGKLGFDDLAKAFQELTKEGGRYGGTTEKLARSIDGLISTAIGEWEEFRREVGEVISKTLGLSGGIDDIIAAFKEFRSYAVSAVEEVGAEFKKFNLGPSLFEFIKDYTYYLTTGLRDVAKLVIQITASFEHQALAIYNLKDNIAELIGLRSAADFTDAQGRQAELAVALGGATTTQELIAENLEVKRKLKEAQDRKNKEIDDRIQGQWNALENGVKGAWGGFMENVGDLRDSAAKIGRDALRNQVGQTRMEILAAEREKRALEKNGQKASRRTLLESGIEDVGRTIAQAIMENENERRQLALDEARNTKLDAINQRLENLKSAEAGWAKIAPPGFF